MPSPSHLLLDFPELSSHAVASGFPFDLELTPAACSADEGKAEKVEGFRFSEPALSASPPKLEWVLSQLDEIRRSKEKVIIFCEFRAIQRLLRHYIQEVFNYTPDIINGDTSPSAGHQRSRQKRINDFQAKPGFGTIILSPLAVGFGLNIQAANHVVHYTARGIRQKRIKQLIARIA